MRFVESRIEEKMDKSCISDPTPHVVEFELSLAWAMG